MQVISWGLLCVRLASSPLPLLSKVSIIGPHQMEQQREILLKSGKRKKKKWKENVRKVKVPKAKPNVAGMCSDLEREFLGEI